MSIATEITALNNNLAAAKTAVTNKGGTVGDTGLAGLSSEIASIPSGGGYTPSEPPVPEGCYAKIYFKEIEHYLEAYVSFDSNINVSVDYLQLNSRVDPNILGNAIFRQDPNYVMLYNIGLKWNNNDSCFELYYTDSNNNDVMVDSAFTTEELGIQLNPQTTFYDDTEIAGFQFMVKPSVSTAVSYITSASAFNILMEPHDPYYDIVEGSPIPGLMDIDGNTRIVEKSFIMDINFGTLASSITSIGNRFMSGVPYLIGIHNLPSGITSVGNYFLSSTPINNYLALPSSLATIGEHFMEYCILFNQPLDLSYITSIGSNFLTGCYSFNQPITIPSGITLGTANNYYFMHRCDSMTSTITINASADAIGSSNFILSTVNNSAPCYTTGITLAGTYASAWKTKLPDRNTQPYRKLI